MVVFTVVTVAWYWGLRADYLRRSAISAELRLGLRCRARIVPTWLGRLARLTGSQGYWPPPPLEQRTAWTPNVSLIHPILMTHTSLVILFLVIMLVLFELIVASGIDICTDKYLSICSIDCDMAVFQTLDQQQHHFF